MREHGENGSVVTLICDGGERYRDTYYDDSWVTSHGLELEPYTKALDAFLDTGRLELPGMQPPGHLGVPS
jgi:cysteine synthase A